MQDSSDKQLDVNVNLNGFAGLFFSKIFVSNLWKKTLKVQILAQKCAFPFKFNSNLYSSCIQDTYNYNWCSPSSTFNGQIIKCDPIGFY